MNRFQFTARDYLAYVQMSNHGHVLVENDEKKRSVEELLSKLDPGTYADVNVDDVEYLLYFEIPYSQEEKIGYIFSNAIRSPYASKLVRVMMEHVRLNRALLVPINDTLSVTERTEEVLNKIVSRSILADRPSEVRDYLLQHIDLIDLLPFIARVAAERFAADTQLSLELYRDPEVEDVYLAIFGRTQQYDETFFEAINLIRQEYTDLLTGKSGWILVTTDFDVPHQGESYALQLD